MRSVACPKCGNKVVVTADRGRPVVPRGPATELICTWGSQGMKFSAIADRLHSYRTPTGKEWDYDLVRCEWLRAASAEQKRQRADSRKK